MLEGMTRLFQQSKFTQILRASTKMVDNEVFCSHSRERGVDYSPARVQVIDSDKSSTRRLHTSFLILHLRFESSEC